MVEKQILDLKLVCLDLPQIVPPGLSELRLGVQARQIVRQDVPCPSDQVVFRFPVQVAQEQGSGILDFSGEYVHGPRGGRFIYLCWGEWEDETWHGVRRAKLALNSAPPGLVEEALQSRQPLRAVIHMTDSKGQPVAASLKPGLYEWML